MPNIQPPLAGVDNPRLQAVYFAAPVSTYRTDRYADLRRAVFERFPEALILPARDLFADQLDRRRRFPLVLPLIDEFLFIDDGAGYISRSLHDELQAISAWGKPAQLLDSWGRLHLLASLKLTLVGEGSDPTRYARVTVARAPRE